MNDKQSGVRVLLVDDERDFLQATAKALERRGFIVRMAGSASEARAIAAESQFEVAVLDVRLPDGDGHDLFLELKDLAPELQAIMLTGNRDAHRAFNLSHRGLYEYLDKPCDMDQLARVIREARQAKEEQDEMSLPLEETTSGGERIGVLLIDDEEDYVKSLGRVLKRRGLTVYQAMTGEEGLRVLEREPVDVAVLDLKMPGLSGLDVLRRIKQDHPQVEVILLTGHATVESGIEGMKLGAADYIFKPQDPDALLRRIQCVAAKSKPAPAGGKRSWWPFGRKE